MSSVSSYALKVADITLVMRTANSRPRLSLSDHVADFVTGDPPMGDLVVRVGSRAPNPDNAIPLARSSYGWTILSYLDGGYRVDYGKEPNSITTTLLVSSDFSHAELYVSSLGDSEYEAQVLSNSHVMLRVLFTGLLSRYAGMLMHGSGVSYKQRGILCIGYSGAGKSTLANLWRLHGNAVVLNDDCVAVRRIGEDFWLFGTPWQGNSGGCSQGSAELKHILFLQHAPEDRVVPLSAPEAVTRLLAQTYLPIWNQESVDAVSTLCVNLVDQVPCYEVGFVPGAAIIDLLCGLK